LPAGQETIVHWNTVGGDYFRVMGIPLLRGRLPSEGEKWEEVNTVIVNQSFARLLFGDEDPVGKSFRQGDRTASAVLSATCGSGAWPNRPRRSYTSSTHNRESRIRGHL
jgi:hypothetical protein